MKPADFEYVAPESLEEALAVLAAEPEAKVLAGGQSLVPLLNMRLARPSVLVDLRRIEGLDSIERADGSIRIGALVRQRDAEFSPELARGCPLFIEALRFVGHPQIRSRGTVGGSLAHADPAAELPAILVLLDGVLHAQGTEGARSIPAREFFESYFTTTLRPDEVLTAVEVPVQPPSARWACQEFTRRPGDFPLCGCAVLVEVDENEVVRAARIVLFGVAETPYRPIAAEAALIGQRAGSETLPEVARLAVAGLSPRADVHASSSFRKHLAEIVTRRTLSKALGKAAQQ